MLQPSLHASKYHVDAMKVRSDCCIRPMFLVDSCMQFFRTLPHTLNLRSSCFWKFSSGYMRRKWELKRISITWEATGWLLNASAVVHDCQWSAAIAQHVRGMRYQCNTARCRTVQCFVHYCTVLVMRIFIHKVFKAVLCPRSMYRFSWCKDTQYKAIPL